MITKDVIDEMETRMCTHKNGTSVFSYIRMYAQKDRLVVCTGGTERTYKYEDILKLSMTAKKHGKPTAYISHVTQYSSDSMVVTDTIKVVDTGVATVELSITCKEY